MNSMADSGTKAEQAAHQESIARPGMPRANSSEKELKVGVPNEKLDKHGYPLVPQPSDNIDDPLVNDTLRKRRGLANS